MSNEVNFQNIISHAKEYGFVFQSSEIYDGLAAVYDYGQAGVELRRNLRDYLLLFYVNMLDVDTITVTILEPEAAKELDKLESRKLIRIDKLSKKKKRDRVFGSMKGLVIHIADEFNAPMEDFKDYM